MHWLQLFWRTPSGGQIQYNRCWMHQSQDRSPLVPECSTCFSISSGVKPRDNSGTHLFAFVGKRRQQWFQHHYQHLQIFLCNKSVLVEFRRTLVLTWSWYWHSISSNSSASLASASLAAIHRFSSSASLSTTRHASSSSNLFHSSQCLTQPSLMM